ncbi:MAG: tripartite tricarboxylate transporter permease [Methanobacterium sp.]|nr:tripartite tricarboxylate transporter permease [Methanobacterium sp.]
MFELIFACIIGVLCGVVTGLIPGIHVNTVGAFVFASSTTILAFLSPEFLAVFLMSMSISHALLEFIPSMFLGVPEEGTVMSVLPGHHLLLQGRGKEAIRLVALGGFGAILVTIIFFPLFALILPALYGFLKPFIWILLILVVIYMFIRLNRDLQSIAWSVVIFLFSGIMGWVMLNSPVSSGVSLLCMFTGLFGVSTLIFSLSQSSLIPAQNQDHSLHINSNILRGIFAGGIAGSILGFLPGMGPAQGSLLAQEISGGGDKGDNKDGFLVAMSGVNVSDALFSLIAIFLIGNPRSGIAVYIDKIVELFDFEHLILYIFVSITAISLSLILCLKLGDLMSEYIQKLNYNRLSWLVIGFMSFLVLLFTLMEHANILFILIVYVTSIALGLLPHYLGLNKSNLMGVLIVPAIVIYMGIT